MSQVTRASVPLTALGNSCHTGPARWATEIHEDVSNPLPSRFELVYD